MKKLRERDTTAKTFTLMREEIENYSASNSFGKSKRELKEEYANCIEIIKTLSKGELMLLWYIRSCGIGALSNFLRVAKKLFTAYNAFEKLK